MNEWYLNSRLLASVNMQPDYCLRENTSVEQDEVWGRNMRRQIVPRVISAHPPPENMTFLSVIDLGALDHNQKATQAIYPLCITMYI